jgi:hypothetical protein
VANAAAPATVSCNVNELVKTSWGTTGKGASTKAFNKTGQFNHYFPLVVNPPIKTISDTQGLDCGIPGSDGSVTCFVATSTGVISAKMNFASTYGKYYYRAGYLQKSYTNQCTAAQADANGFCCLGNNTPSNVNAAGTGADFVLNVPAQTILFSFNGTTAENQPPTNPTIDGPITSYIDVINNFNVVSNDPDGDDIKYIIDWDAGTPSVESQLIPSSGFVTSNISQNFSHSWINLETKSFRVMAQDSKGASSGWTTYNIEIVETPICLGEELCNGECVAIGTICCPTNLELCNGQCVSLNTCASLDTSQTIDNVTVSARLTPNIVNSGQYCTATWTITGDDDSAYSCDVYGVGQIQKYVDKDTVKGGVQVEPGYKYQVICANNSNSSLISKSQDVNCFKNYARFHSWPR